MTGEPRENTKDQNPAIFSGVAGVFKLLTYLEGKMAQQPLELLANKMDLFFYGLQRERGETMPNWSERHHRAYKLCRRGAEKVCFVAMLA